MSAAGPGCLSRSATRVVAKQANGFHLLRIDGYAETKKVLPGQKLSSNTFIVGGHSWRIDYYPNGRDNHDAISVYLQLLTDQYTQKHLQARYKFSLLDHGGAAAYELPAENGSFTSVVSNYPHHRAVRAVDTLAGGGGEEEPGPGCGHEEFIGKEDLERREHLIRDDSIVVRCDVGVTEIGNSVLAHDDLNLINGREMTWEEAAEYHEQEMYDAPPTHRHNQRRRRADDNEYVKWCLDQRHH